MSFDKCLKAALDAKKITGKKAKEAIDLYEGTADEFMRKGMAETEARVAAAKQVTDHIVWEKVEQKRRMLKQIQKQAEVQMNIDKYIEKNGIDNVGDAAVNFFAHNDRAGYSNFETRYDRRRGQIQAEITDILGKYEPKVVGIVRPKAGLSNIVRELFGKETGDAAAKELAEAWKGAAELARKMFVRAGGSMAKRENWRLPQHQDAQVVRRIGKEQWTKDHMDWLDWDEMRNPQTGRSIAPAEREAVLGYVYDTISSEGWAHTRPGTANRKSIGNKLDQHRFLQFKDPDAWLAMHEKYGDGSVFDAMVGYVDRMARDIALMETFGPNPHSTMEIIKATVRNRAGKKPEIIDKTKRALYRAEELYKVATNANAASEGHWLVNGFGAVANILVSSYMGAAALTAIATDSFTKVLTKGFNKMPGAVSMRQYLKLMNPANAADRKLAIRSGLVAENATSLAFAQLRFMGDLFGPRITRRIADTVLRASLLSPHTQAARWAFGMEMFGMFADSAGKSFDELPFKDMLARYNITSADWDILRTTDKTNHKGADFLMPDSIFLREDLGDDVKFSTADKFMDMLMSERQYAVPTATMEAKVALTGSTRADTFRGALLKSFGMFKNFPTAILMLHGRRGLQQSTASGKAAYFAAFGVGMTLTGGLALQAREIAKGRDPLAMDTGAFWGRAALLGGGMGIWGDFLFSGLNRFGGGPTETAAGPVISFAGDTLNLTLGNVLQFLNGEETKLPAELVEYARRHTPGTNIWYARAVLQRIVWDQLQKEADPKAYQKFRRMQRHLLSTTGQQEWWPAGQTLPTRAPNLGAAAGK